MSGGDYLSVCSPNFHMLNALMTGTEQNPGNHATDLCSFAAIM